MYRTVGVQTTFPNKPLPQLPRIDNEDSSDSADRLDRSEQVVSQTGRVVVKPANTGNMAPIKEKLLTYLNNNGKSTENVVCSRCYEHKKSNLRGSLAIAELNIVDRNRYQAG